MENAKNGWTLSGLSEESGVPARTVRFYIARGLLDPPAVAGRGAVYGDAHLGRLREIRALQAKGLTLAEIGLMNAAARREQPLPAPESWWQYRLSGDVVISLRAGMSPWRLRQVRAWMDGMKDQGEIFGVPRPLATETLPIGNR